MSTWTKVLRICMCLATLVLLVASATGTPGQSSVESLLAEREAEMGRNVDARLRPAVLARMEALEATNAIGDTDADLVFTPLAPCRIIDTRVPTSGILTVGVPRAFTVAGDSSVFQLQGGQPGGCAVPVGATAAMLNLVATGSAGPGNLRAIPWAAGTPTMPTASIINFGLVSGLASIANGLALPICDPAVTTCNYDLNVQAYVNNTHFVVDVVGYFSSVTGVVTGAQAPLMVSAGAVGLSSSGCAAGYVWKWTGSSWACQADANTTYSASSPVSLSGTTFGLSTSGCGIGYVWKWTGSGWTCALDNNTTYAAGTGLNLVGTTFSVDKPQVRSFTVVDSGGATTNIGTTCTHYPGAEVTVTAPVAGTITVMVNAWLNYTHTNGTAENVYLVPGTSDTDCGFWGGFTGYERIPASYPTTSVMGGALTMSVMRQFSVAAGAHTYYLNAQGTPANAFQLYYSGMSATFEPN